MKDLINCPAERAIYFLGGKWKIRILFTLYNNKKVRFNELKNILTSKTSINSCQIFQKIILTYVYSDTKQNVVYWKVS